MQGWGAWVGGVTTALEELPGIELYTAYWTKSIFNVWKTNGVKSKQRDKSIWKKKN